MRIHEQNKILKERVRILEEGIQNIQRYLYSEKFDVDTSVNKKDVLLRIEETQSEVNKLPEILFYK